MASFIAFCCWFCPAGLADPARAAGHHAHVLEHLHERREHLARLIAVARARQILDRLEQILQIALRHRPRVRRHLPRLLVLTLCVLGELFHVARHRLTQLVHQRADFFIRRAALQRVVQLILHAAQFFGGIGEVAFLERERKVPHESSASSCQPGSSLLLSRR